MATTFAVPDGRVAMAATLYTGNGSYPRTIANTVNTVSFQPDFVWVKARNQTYDHILYDSVRGTGITKNLASNNTAIEGANSTFANLSSFDSTGFTVGSTSSTNVLNDATGTFVGWQWKAGGTAVSNTAGTITSSVSANTTAGFSVVKYTTSTTNSTVGHGLGVAPSLVIVRYIGTISNWFVYHASVGAGSYVMLNSTNAQAALATLWNSTSPTSTVFSVGTAWTAAVDTIAYCWAPVAGYSAFGSYTGNNSTDGPFIYTGFRPRWVMIKLTSGASYDWVILDTSRDTYNVMSTGLQANSSSADNSTSAYYIDCLSNGIKLRNAYAGLNGSGSTYIYACFAENPLRYSNAR